MPFAMCIYDTSNKISKLHIKYLKKIKHEIYKYTNNNTKFADVLLTLTVQGCINYTEIDDIWQRKFNWRNSRPAERRRIWQRRRSRTQRSFPSTSVELCRRNRSS